MYITLIVVVPLYIKSTLVFLVYSTSIVVVRVNITGTVVFHAYSICIVVVFSTAPVLLWCCVNYW